MSKTSLDQGPARRHQGKHENQPNKVPEDEIERIESHIRSFPAESSHYSRSCNPNHLYLSPTLSISKMYQLYLESSVEENRKWVSEFIYREVFVTKFNLGFGHPKTDTCAKCTSDPDDQTHKANYHNATEAMKNDRERAKQDHGIMFLTFDLEKTLPLPKISTLIAFYLRQLWFYNCGVHMILKENENGFMFN
uniref:Uncharacterized protein n=1 Tax=Romanomermis culicivorax TaxID=13658 RepID=A0A915K0J0_ROMCU